jgi:hypothetical protein
MGLIEKYRVIGESLIAQGGPFRGYPGNNPPQKKSYRTVRVQGIMKEAINAEYFLFLLV